MPCLCLHMNKYHKNIGKRGMVEWGYFFQQNSIDSWVLENFVLTHSLCTFCSLSCLFSMSLEKLEASNWINKLALRKAESVGQSESQHYYKISLFPYIFIFVSFPKLMPTLSHFFTPTIVILIDMSRNGLQVNFPIKKVISAFPRGI